VSPRAGSQRRPTRGCGQSRAAGAQGRGVHPLSHGCLPWGEPSKQGTEYSSALISSREAHTEGHRLVGGGVRSLQFAVCSAGCGARGPGAAGARARAGRGARGAIRDTRYAIRDGDTAIPSIRDDTIHDTRYTIHDTRYMILTQDTGYMRLHGVRLNGVRLNEVWGMEVGVWRLGYGDWGMEIEVWRLPAAWHQGQTGEAVGIPPLQQEINQGKLSVLPRPQSVCHME